MDAKDLTKILVVDDNPDDGFLLCKQIKKYRINLSITVIANGNDALNHLLTDPQLPALIFLDLVLPGLKGTQVIRRLRAEDRLSKIPIVVVTGSIDPKDEEECSRLGVDFFLLKPASASLLQKAIARLLP